MHNTAGLLEFLGRQDFEALRLETYGLKNGVRKIVITHTGKVILNGLFGTKETAPKNYLQRAYDRVFFWVDDVALRSAEERDEILGTLERYALEVLRSKISPSPSIVWECGYEGHRVRYTRHWHPSRSIVRTFCSVVEAGRQSPKCDGIILSSEVRHSVFYELPPNKQPLARDVVIGELLARIKQEEGKGND